ncbi:uncharacterized protein LOC118408651 [Branchiostoma floridae]|uniref:Uncharacterized protein LOC118408651 n=2 Tax=Branchiostoma floridae TaxID=7739 RepID=A0A9J7KIS6_BRAFL|nr:uncharacterized protein LOC118408651 [Branchiostoma floridae]
MPAYCNAGVQVFFRLWLISWLCSAQASRQEDGSGCPLFVSRIVNPTLHEGYGVQTGAKLVVLSEDAFLGGYSRVESYTCEEHDVIDTATNTTPAACAMACTAHGSCEAFVYIRGLGSCSLLPLCVLQQNADSVAYLKMLCGSTLTVLTRDRKFYSNNPYENFENCSIVLKAPDGYVLTMTVSDVDIVNGDYLEGRLLSLMQDFVLKEFCPYGWWAYGESCYYISRVPTTYETAKTSCRNMAAHLADVSSTDEHMFISRHATVKPGEAYWIGLKYRQVEMTARTGADHITAEQAYFDYFTLVPVMTDFVKITLLTVYTQFNNGFLEVQFITAFPDAYELNYALRRFRAKKNTASPVGLQTLSLTASLAQCAAACLEGILSPCYSFNYFHGNRTCQLTDHLTTGADTVPSVGSDFYHHNVQGYRLTIWVPGERCMCVRHRLVSPPLVPVNCDSSLSDQTWLHTPNGAFMNVQTRQCMEILSTNDVVMSPCDPLTASKYFTLKDLSVWQVDGRDVCLGEHSGRVQVVGCNIDPSMAAIVTRKEFEDFVESDPTQSSMCEVKLKLCQIGDGVSYRGTVSVTVTGKTCQRWDSQTPHSHDTTPANYPSSGLVNNYCRNPGDWTGVWCYTTDPSTRWELCAVPVCGTLEQRRVCERETLSIHCPAGQQINIVSALFGRTSSEYCSDGPIYTTNCRSPHSLARVRTSCQGKPSCSVQASYSVFGDPCVGTGKYLEVKFTCIAKRRALETVIVLG